MSELPTVGRSAYWTAYRELVKKSWTGWLKKTAYAQLLFLVGFAVHALYLKKKVEAFESLEIHLVYVVAPSLLFLAVAFALSLLRAPFQMAQNIQDDRDTQIGDLKTRVGELNAQVERSQQNVKAARREDQRQLEKERERGR